jgi:hypothetical protein
MQDMVFQMQKNHRPLNTKLAYEGKVAEYKAFCNAFYGCNAYSHTVTSNKLFRFLFYQAFRNKRLPQKGKSLFNAVELVAIEERYERAINLLRAGESSISDMDIPDPPDPVKYDTMNTYRSAVHSVWLEQRSRNANTLRWKAIVDAKVRVLLEVVKGRSRRIARRNYREKIDTEFSPFSSFQEVGQIEWAFWQQCYGAPRTVFPALRNRFIFLMCYSGLLRHESLYIGELSDMTCTTYQRQVDADPVFLMVLQIATGKCL